MRTWQRFSALFTRGIRENIHNGDESRSSGNVQYYYVYRQTGLASALRNDTFDGLASRPGVWTALTIIMGMIILVVCMVIVGYKQICR